MDGRGRDLSIQECLLYAGHVGIAFSADRPIYGFKPKCEPGSIAKTLDALLDSQTAFPGVVSDDTEVFAEAERRKLGVVRKQYDLTEDEYDAVESIFKRELQQSGFMYCFPGGPGDCNCATWPEKLGLRIPHQSGQMKAYVEAMKKTAEQNRPEEA